MNWDAIGAVGELLGSLVVLATLAYLAIQVRHARSEAGRALSQSRTESIRELMRLELDQPNLEIRLKADAAFDAEPNPLIASIMKRSGLSVDDATRLLMIIVAHWNYVIQMIPLVDDLSAMERTSFEGFVRSRFGTPGVYRYAYESWLRTANEEATNYVDGVIAKQSSWKRSLAKP